MDDPGALGFALSSEGGAGAGSVRRTATVHGITVETDEQVRLVRAYLSFLPAAKPPGPRTVRVVRVVGVRDWDPTPNRK